MSRKTAIMVIVRVCMLSALVVVASRGGFRGHLSNGHRVPCSFILLQIANAKETWRLENKKTNGDIVTWADIQPYLGRGTAGSLPACPQGGTYTIGRVGQTPKCSIGGEAHTCLDWDKQQ